MKRCCEITFKRAIEGVIFTINTHNLTHADDIILVLQNAIEMLEKKKEKENE